MKKVYLNKIKEMIDLYYELTPDIDKIDFIVGMSRGGLIPATLLATKANKPLVACYIDKHNNIYCDRLEWLAGKSILIVDDIVRSGLTISLVVDKLNSLIKMKSLNVFILYNVAPMNMKGFKVPLFAIETSEDIKFPWDYDR